ncbi:MAG: hypothetical protein GY917_15775, partial [Planctomycetaceae bacterium]|nr:hypothetical protein [Planctomycetaceae bacterium]
MNPGLLGSVETGVATVDTVVFACLLVGLIICLAMEEKLHAKKSVIAGTFAIVCLLLGTIRGVLPFDDVVVGSHQVSTHQGIEGTFQGHDEKKDFKAFVLYDTSHRMEDKALIKEVNRLRKGLSPEWKFFVKRHSRSPNVFGKIDGIGTLDGPEEQIVYFADRVGFTFPS